MKIQQKSFFIEKSKFKKKLQISKIQDKEFSKIKQKKVNLFLKFNILKLKYKKIFIIKKIENNILN